MSKKKKFSLSNSLSQGLADTISIVENNEGKFRNSIIPLARIEKDPENPRNLLLNLDDILQGLSKSDPKFKQKSLELSKIHELANSIDNSGLLNPITVYKYSEKYRIIAGECRFLAYNLIGKKEIDCRILQTKPSIFELRLMQWFENTQRNDLSLFERLENIKSVVSTSPQYGNDKSIKANKLQEIFRFSKSQAAVYASVLNSPDEVYSLIENNQLNNLDKAAYFSSLVDKDKRDFALSLHDTGHTLSQIKAIVKEKYTPKVPNRNNSKVNENKFSLGSVSNYNVIHQVIDAVITNPKYSYLRDCLQLNLDDKPDNIMLAFKKIITTLEKGIDK